MEIYTTIRLSIEPVVALWTQDDEAQCRILEDERAGFAFYYGNHLADYDGVLRKENGEIIPTPPQGPP